MRGRRTDRFLRMFEIARQLDAPPYRQCPSEYDLTSLRIVSGMFASKPTYAPGNIDRMLMKTSNCKKLRLMSDS